MSSGESLRRRLTRPALCLFFTYHVAAITVANVPRTTALGDSLHRPFAPYTSLTSLGQTWDMFTTIPRFAKLHGELVVETRPGEVRHYPPVLPDLVESDSARIVGTFLRLAFVSNSYGGYSDRYLAAVCRTFTEKNGAPPLQVGFELSALQLRKLEDVRKDGRIAEPKTFTFGPTPCAR